jgi:hypothetical protein
MILPPLPVKLALQNIIMTKNLVLTVFDRILVIPREGFYVSSNGFVL